MLNVYSMSKPLPFSSVFVGRNTVKEGKAGPSGVPGNCYGYVCRVRRAEGLRLYESEGDEFRIRSTGRRLKEMWQG